MIPKCVHPREPSLPAARCPNRVQAAVVWLAVLAGFTAGSAAAATWMVDNNPGHAADFRTLQEAHDDARVVHGDTLYVAGSQTQYPAASFIKSLTVYGPGYFLAENRPPLNSLSSAEIAGITLTSNPGGGFDPPSSSAGSLLMGLGVGSIDVNVPNITVQRCRIHLILVVHDHCDNIAILQSYVYSIERGGGTGGIQLVDNLLIANCYIYAIAIAANVNGAVVQNNVVQAVFRVSTPNSTVANNILLFADPASFAAAGIFQHNMLAAAASFLPATDGNLNYVNPVDVFVASGTTDGRWQLKPGSLAAGAGVNGEDLGMFGGATPYKLSGLPPIPVVKVDAAATGTGLSGLRIHVDSSAQN